MTVLVTGASGYLGSAIVRILSARGHNVLAAVHAQNDIELEDKRNRLASLAIPSQNVVAWDINEPSPSSVPAGSITHVIHAAAVTSFNVERDVAQRVNVQGSENVFNYAASLPKLEKLCFVSTLYASGLRTGVIDEVPFDDSAGFANNYEWSKWCAEEMLLEKFAGLPTAIARVSTALSDDESGTVSQFNAVHNTLKLLYFGLVSLVPGKSETPLYFVTRDWAAQVCADIATDQTSDGIYHVTTTADDTLNLGQLLDKSFEIFSQSDDFVKRGVIPPVLVDEQSFELMREGVGGFTSSIVQQSLDSIGPFAPQLFVDKRVIAQRIKAITSEQLGSISQVFEKMCAYLIGSRWGRNV